MKKKVKDDNVANINPYEIDKLSRVPSWVIILLLKYWAATAASYLLFGLRSLGWTDLFVAEAQFQTQEEFFNTQMAINIRIILMLSLFTGIFLNYFVKNVVRLMYNRRNNTYRYNILNIKGFKAFLIYLVYGFILTMILYYLFVCVLSPNHLVWDPFGTTGGIGIEPFTYGLYFVLIDGVFVLIKNIIQSIAERVRYKKLIMAD